MENREGGGREALDRLGQSTDSDRPTHRVERWRTGREGAGRLQNQTDPDYTPKHRDGGRGATTGTCSPTSQPTHTFKRVLEDLDRQGVSELH